MVKITTFLPFYTYLLPFLELPWVKYLEIRQSCESDFGQYFNLKKCDTCFYVPLFLLSLGPLVVCAVWVLIRSRFWWRQSGRRTLTSRLFQMELRKPFVSSTLKYSWTADRLWRSSTHTLHGAIASAGVSTFSGIVAITWYCIAKMRSAVLRASLVKALICCSSTRIFKSLFRVGKRPRRWFIKASKLQLFNSFDERECFMTCCCRVAGDPHLFKHLIKQLDSFLKEADTR